MARPSRQSGAAGLLWVAGAALASLALLGSGAKHANAADSWPLEEAADLSVLRAEAEFESGARVVRVQVLRGLPGQVVVEVEDFVVGTDTLLASGQMLYTRDADSREPLMVPLSMDQRFVVVQPHAEWGRVHRDTGLGIAMHLTD
ncbi:MAG: hypothetical protein CMJ94_12830 [Planctomycetes bacterium]|nr:hypothetical protein [Planctomycetota bacterium]|tara:strand:- start:319 stop:753 length:435 start_codon:yes stop_codon:yes gene_type:complete